MQCPLQGFVITDWEGIDRISDPPGSNYRECVKLAINAGIDVVEIENLSSQPRKEHLLPQ